MALVLVYFDPDTPIRSVYVPVSELCLSFGYSLFSSISQTLWNPQQINIAFRSRTDQKFHLLPLKDWSVAQSNHPSRAIPLVLSCTRSSFLHHLKLDSLAATSNMSDDVHYQVSHIWRTSLATKGPDAIFSPCGTNSLKVCPSTARALGAGCRIALQDGYIMSIHQSCQIGVGLPSNFSGLRSPPRGQTPV